MRWRIGIAAIVLAAACDEDATLCPERDWFADADGDGLGDDALVRRACSAPPGFVATGGDNCPDEANPQQEDADRDGTGDGCVPRAPCSDLAEGNVAELWTASAEGRAETTITTIADAARGVRAIRVQTKAPFDFALRLAFPGGRPFDAAGRDELRLAVRGLNTNRDGWQGRFPVVKLVDAAGGTNTYTPVRAQIGTDDVTWRPLVVPLEGGGGWLRTGDADLGRLAAIELHADTWGEGFRIDVDAVSFEAKGTVCAPACPADCSGHGRCSAATLGCECEPGYTGAACEGCAIGWAVDGAACVLESDGSAARWPNAFSRANSDPWLAAHHDEIAELHPRLLVLDYVNRSTPEADGALVQRIIDGFREGSRGQLQYELARPIVDLRDGVDGRPAAPAGWTKENSTLYPRRRADQPGAWRFDYARLFGSDLAPIIALSDPDAPEEPLSICELVDRGLVHEVWIVGSGDVEDANAAEVLEAKPRYTRGGNRLPGRVERCAGNGCFDDDVPFCGRSLRIGWVNYARGPGCYLHSQGHMLEGTARSGALPALTDWFEPFARFDLDREGLPFTSWYDLACATRPCLSRPAPDAVDVTTQDQSFELKPFDGRCGNVHFPPNGVDHYDYANAAEVESSCASFGAGGATARVGAKDWAEFETLAPDCGGAFLVWWFRHMPAHGAAMTHPDGAPMKSVWTYLFY